MATVPALPTIKLRIKQPGVGAEDKILLLTKEKDVVPFPPIYVHYDKTSVAIATTSGTPFVKFPRNSEEILLDPLNVPYIDISERKRKAEALAKKEERVAKKPRQEKK